MDPAQNLMDQAKTQYPILNNYDIKYKENFGRGQGYLESWPPGETGSTELPRPSEFGANDFGLEVYDKTTRPIDILGDVVSHHLVNVDPVLKNTYKNFISSIEPWQENILKEQYSHAKEKYGENRPFDDWKEISGLPAYFRGYPFQQWDNSEHLYTKDQIKNLDEMMKYVANKPSSQNYTLVPVAGNPFGGSVGK